MEKPMTTCELFNKIRDILKEKEILPDILDYALADDEPVPIKTYQFRLKSDLSYGGSEGIYLYLWIEFLIGGKYCKKGLGIFKTLREDREAMYIMSRLLADFIIEESAYVNENLEDFTWEGVEVYPADEPEKIFYFKYHCTNMEDALKRKDELLQKYSCVVVKENSTRKEKIFRVEEE